MPDPERQEPDAAQHRLTERAARIAASDLSKESTRLAGLIASGQLPLSVAFEQPDPDPILRAVGRARRRRLLRLIAQEIARDIARSSRSRTEL